jgi:hypothetical protein
MNHTKYPPLTKKDIRSDIQDCRRHLRGLEEALAKGDWKDVAEWANEASCIASLIWDKVEESGKVES